MGTLGIAVEIKCEAMSVTDVGQAARSSQHPALSPVLKCDSLSFGDDPYSNLQWWFLVKTGGGRKE
ncbi:hypothetical protein STEG23_008526, partial [Scotinomys teguina]